MRAKMPALLAAVAKGAATPSSNPSLAIKADAVSADEHCVVLAAKIVVVA